MANIPTPDLAGAMEASEFTKEQFSPDPGLLAILSVLSLGSPAAMFARLIQIAEMKIIEYEEELRTMAMEEIEKIKAKVMEQIPSKQELIEKFKNAACNPAAQKTMDRVYNRLKELLEGADGKLSGIRNKLSGLEKKGNVIKERILKIGKVLKKILTWCVSIAIAVFALDLIMKALPARWTTVGLGLSVGKFIDWCKRNVVTPIVNLKDSIPQWLADFGNFTVKLIAVVLAVLATLIALSELIKFLLKALEALYLKYLNICNVEDQNKFPNEDLQTTLEDVDSDDDDKLTDLYTQTLNDLEALGNLEVIERIRRADFKQIGYKRYKI